MKKTQQRAISVLLCAVLAVGTLASCGSGTADDTPAVSGTAAETVSGNVQTAEDVPVSPLYELEKQDFGGRAFRISMGERYVDEMWVESENGDVCNDAVWARNAAVEEYFNVKIIPVVTPGSYNDDQVKAITKTMMAGDDVFDLTAVFTYLAGKPALDGLYYSWNDIPNVDFSREWWVQSANEAFSIGGDRYVAVGDLSITTLLLSYAVFFNRRVAEEYDFPDLYQAVLDGVWTIDMLTALAKDLYKDINSDAKLDEGDFYGFACDAITNLDAYTTAFDIPLTEKDENGNPVLCLDIGRMQTALEKVYSLYYDYNAFVVAGSATDAESRLFANGNAAFLTTWMNHCYTTFRDMEDDYGILPYPKLDEAQTAYYSNSMDNYSLLSVPKTVTDPAFVGLITEALTRENHHSVLPAYYDVALTEKFARDEQSVAMLDIIMDTRQYDFSILYSSQTSRLAHLFRDMIAAKDTNAASKMAKIEKAVTAGLEELAEGYAALGT